MDCQLKEEKGQGANLAARRCPRISHLGRGGQEAIPFVTERRRMKKMQTLLDSSCILELTYGRTIEERTRPDTEGWLWGKRSPSRYALWISG